MIICSSGLRCCNFERALGWLHYFTKNNEENPCNENEEIKGGKTYVILFEDELLSSTELPENFGHETTCINPE
jgi:hypothetical protein